MGSVALIFACAACGPMTAANPLLVMSIPSRWDRGGYVLDPNGCRQPICEACACQQRQEHSSAMVRGTRGRTRPPPRRCRWWCSPAWGCARVTPHTIDRLLNRRYDTVMWCATLGQWTHRLWEPVAAIALPGLVRSAITVADVSAPAVQPWLPIVVSGRCSCCRPLRRLW